MRNTCLHPNQDHRSRSSGDLRQDIVRYYDESYVDYRFAWLDGNNLAIHYGYWDEDTPSHAASLIRMNQALAEQAAPQAGEEILDAGCGLGGSSLWLAEQYPARVTGITLSADQVRRAEGFAAKRTLQGEVRFQVADFCATPFPEESFDVVWALESVCYAVEKERFVREAYRLLKPGGRLVLADGLALRREFTAEEWRGFVAFLDGWEVPNLATPEELTGYLHAAGFASVQHTDLTPKVWPSAVRMYRTALLIYPLEKILSLVGIRTAAQSGNYYAGYHQYRLFREGMTGYGLFLAQK